MGIEKDSERALVRITAYANGRREAVVLHIPTRMTEVYASRANGDPSDQRLVIDGQAYYLEHIVAPQP